MINTLGKGSCWRALLHSDTANRLWRENFLFFNKITDTLYNLPFHDFGNGKRRVRAHRNRNGGGWVANTADVAATAYIGENARVYDEAIVTGHARVFGHARVSGMARVGDQARIGGKASVSMDAHVYDDALIAGEAIMREVLSPINMHG